LTFCDDDDDDDEGGVGDCRYSTFLDTTGDSNVVISVVVKVAIMLYDF
jgi:hypothetical protein